MVVAQDPHVEAMLDDVSIDSLIYYSSAISGEFSIEVNGNVETILSRNKNFPGNAVAADYIEQKFQEFGLATSVQTFGATGENVLATQPGIIFPNQKVVICGHYDSMPSNGTASPAADDDGSGTAAVIEAARVLSQYNFAYTIVYAAWDEEEYGLVGSNFYANQAEDDGDSLVAVINVDAIAWDGDGDSLARVHVSDIANSVSLGTVAASMISTYEIGLQIETNSPGATYSDHASFWNHGFSAILLIEDFDNDGNPHYHTATDLVEHFDTMYFEQISKWAFATTATMAVPLAGNVGISEKDNNQFNIYPNPVT
ncbi:MAG: Zn-dependent M28 family amino/carboxypeptidase, partial [Bacteroidia bacterium]